MAGSSAGLHEDPEKLKPETIDRHRAIVSLMEEFEAVDWYAQRVDATTDPDLREILAHNRDEEKEHAAMVLEWLRRSDPSIDDCLKTYLFSEGAITELEEAETSDGSDGESGGAPRKADGSLGIGSLKGRSEA
ncbi:MAG TPA: ferritin-like domain-containing protein [Alphaproteobacteria bacterium]|nr:ferritin-like domain-containing protein [Alphaproteobacteria bacterium]